MAASGRLPRLGRTRLPLKFLEQRLGFFQIGGIKALGEPVVDVGEYRARFVAAALSFRATVRRRSSRAAPCNSQLSHLLIRQPRRFR